MPGLEGTARAFQAGFQSEGELLKDRHERKQALSDEERQLKVNDIYSQLGAIGSNKGLTKEQKEAAAQKLYLQRNQIYHPVHAPGALQKDWQFLQGLITRHKPYVPAPAPSNPITSPETVPDIKLSPTAQPVRLAETPPVAKTATRAAIPGTPADTITMDPKDIPGSEITLPGTKKPNVTVPVSETMAKPGNMKGLIAPGNIPIWNRPLVQNDDGSHSSEFSVTVPLDQGGKAIPWEVDGKPNPAIASYALVPGIVNGKFLTPDQKIPPEGNAQAQEAYEQAAADYYNKTGQHLGKFNNQQDADKYAGILHTRGERKQPTAAAYEPKPSKYDRQLKAQQEQAKSEAEQFATAFGEEHGGAAQAAKDEAESDAKAYQELNPGAKPEDVDSFKKLRFLTLLGMKPQTSSKWVYKAGKINGVPMMVRWDEKDPQATMQRADGSPLTDDQAQSWVADTGKMPPGMTYDKNTNQVWDKATNKRYNEADPSNPPEVQAMFHGHRSAQAELQAYTLELTKERGQSYNMSRALTVLDTMNGNRPTIMKFMDVLAAGGRYVPAAEADKAIAGNNMFEDIARQSRMTRNAINNLKEDFPEDMQGKIAVALTAEDHGTAFNALLASNLLGTLTTDQYAFLVATRQLAENAMAMRSILGAGQSSDQVRAAIQATLPGLLTPNRQFAIMQLDAFDKTLEQLHGGIKDVPLNRQGWTVKGGGEATGGAQPKRRISISAAVAAWAAKGVTKTPEQVTAEIKSRGAEPAP